MHVSVRHPGIIAILKVGWKECTCILNSDNYVACVYGADQNHHGPIAADGQGQSNDSCTEAEVTSTGA